MAQCVWLLTFEHPSDLHPVYMRFGLSGSGLRWSLCLLKAFKGFPFFKNA